MSETVFGGPRFNVESDRALIGLGNSERREVGELAKATLEGSGLFPGGVEMLTINQLDRLSGSEKLKGLLEDSTIFTHSAAEVYIDSGLQIIAFNSAEPTPVKDLMQRAKAVGKELQIIDAEDGAYKTGHMDTAKAAIQLACSPITSSRTISRISRGHSSSRKLAYAAEAFPAGRAIVHSENDTFRFQDSADLASANQSGVSTAVVPDSYHLSFLREPGRLFTAVMPHILPQVELTNQAA